MSKNSGPAVVILDGDEILLRLGIPNRPSIDVRMAPEQARKIVAMLNKALKQLEAKTETKEPQDNATEN